MFMKNIENMSVMTTLYHLGLVDINNVNWGFKLIEMKIFQLCLQFAPIIVIFKSAKLLLFCYEDILKLTVSLNLYVAQSFLFVC